MQTEYRSWFGFIKIANGVAALETTIGAEIRQSEHFQRLLNRKKEFDVVLVESSTCFELIGLGHHFSAPVISISATYESPETVQMASPKLQSFMPFILNGYTDRMSFWERLHNQYTVILLTITKMLLSSKSQVQRKYELMFPNIEEPPSLLDLQRNVSLLILNSHPALQAPRPFMPHVIEVGGLTLQGNLPNLPNDLQIFLDDAKSGAIYFSFGSIVDLSWMSSKFIQSILSAFKELSNIKFLVKGNYELIALSRDIPNVIVRSWFPQSAILQHPNVKCFVSHGGQNSIQESIFHGKPVIVIPFYLEQLKNSRWAHEKGYGIDLSQRQITKSVMKLAIEDILHNSRFVIQSNFHI